MRNCSGWWFIVLPQYHQRTAKGSPYYLVTSKSLFFVGSKFADVGTRRAVSAITQEIPFTLICQFLDDARYYKTSLYTK